MPNIIIPNGNDVLLGRGGRNHEHSGNEQLRRLARTRVRDYERASKKQKAVISRQILHQIQSLEPEGRFLLKNCSTYEWDVVSDAVAREKVCQALRDAVAIKRDQVCSNDDDFKYVPSEPLPNALDTLFSDSSSEFAVKSDAKRQPEEEGDTGHSRLNVAVRSQIFGSPFMPMRQNLSRHIVTPMKTEAKEEGGGMGEDESPLMLTSVKTNIKQKGNDEVATYHYPVKSHGREENEVVVTYHYRTGFSEDFDLFDGGLLRATEDEVLKDL